MKITIIMDDISKDEAEHLAEQIRELVHSEYYEQYSATVIGPDFS